MVRRSSFSPEPDCAIAQSLAVVGDAWDLLIVRDLARGLDRFDVLAGSLHISRKILTERLVALTASGIVERAPYQERPTRYAYRLTDRGRALLPVLVALQDWGDRWLLSDGELSGTNAVTDPPAHRLHALVGTRIPDDLLLPATVTSAPSTPEEAGTEEAGATTVDVVDEGARATVVFGYPATGRPSGHPEGWEDVPGTHGCTLENRLFRDRHRDFVAQGISVHGVSTQRPDEQRAFADLEDIPHILLSDVDRTLTAALRLPTFRVADTERLKRFVLVAGPDRVVGAVRYPVMDIAAAVDWAYRTATG
jgi:DNA-binding HxlR family transcriptional regulator/peroxiredoxin